MDRKMIYVLNHYSKDTVQHFNHVINLLINIARSNVKVILIIEKCQDPPFIEENNITVVCQKSRFKLFRALEMVLILRMYIKLGYSRTYVRISVNSGLIAVLVNKIYGGKTFYWMSDTNLELDKSQTGFDRLKYYINIHYKLYIIKTFTDFFVTGPESMLHYYNKNLNIKMSKLLLLYNDVDTNRFNRLSEIERNELKIEFGLENIDIILLMVHRLSPKRKTTLYLPKIIEGLIESQLRFKLIIIGDGPEKSLLKEKVDESKVRDKVEFLGNVPNNEIHRWYNVADIFINPSFTEGFARVLIEAMASGLPIVSTDAGGSKDIFYNLQKDFIVNKEDVNLFGEKLFELIHDEKLRADLSSENLIRVKRYSTPQVAKMYIDAMFTNE